MKTNRRSVGTFWPLVAGALTAGCYAEPVAQELGYQRLAVSAGTVDYDDQWAGVVHLTTIVGKDPKVCSGSLVAPNLVLTALHCVAPLAAGEIQCTYQGEPVKPGAGALGPPVAAEQVEIRAGVDAPHNEALATGLKLFTTNSSNICSNDIALLLLDRDLDLPIRPLRLEKATVRGEPLTIVGYGMTESSKDTVARRFRPDVRVLELGNDLNTGPRALTPPRTLSVEPSACQGDSGGPALAQTENHPVVGVNSLVLNDCGADSADGVYTRLPPFRNLILEAFAAAGYEPWLEGQLPPGTEPPPMDAAANSGNSTDDSTDRTSHDAGEPPRTPSGGSQSRRLTSGCALSSAKPGIVYPAQAPPLGLFLGLLVWACYRRGRLRGR